MDHSTLKLNTILGIVQIFYELEFSFESSVENVKKLLLIKIWDFELFFIIVANLLLKKIFKIKYRNYLKERPGLDQRPFETAPLFTAEKCNERPT